MRRLVGTYVSIRGAIVKGRGFESQDNRIRINVLIVGIEIGIAIEIELPYYQSRMKN
jgi:hypothetical protein